MVEFYFDEYVDLIVVIIIELVEGVGGMIVVELGFLY